MPVPYASLVSTFWGSPLALHQEGRGAPKPAHREAKEDSAPCQSSWQSLPAFSMSLRSHPPFLAGFLGPSPPPPSSPLQGHVESRETELPPSPLAPSAGLPKGGHSIHTRSHTTPPQVLVLSPSSVRRIQAQGPLPPPQGSATQLPTATWGCSQARPKATAQANLRQSEGAHPYWVILSCTHWSVSPTMAHLEEKRATKLTGASCQHGLARAHHQTGSISAAG